MTPQQETFDPCKFCDSTDIKEVSGTDRYMFAECQHCGATGPTERVRSTMIAAWNRRAPAPTEPAVDRDAVLVSRAELQAINRAMDHMGDQLNEMDSVEESDLAIVVPGFDAIQRLLATPASPAVPSVDDFDSLIYPPKAMLKREDWDATTRKPRVAVQAVPEPAPLAPNRGTLAHKRIQDMSPLPFPKEHKDMLRRPAYSSAAAPQVAQASQPTSAEELQQKEHIPPSRAEPASQPDASKSVLVGGWFNCTDAVYATPDQSSIAGAAKGGITNDSKGLPTSAEGMTAWAAYCPAGFQFIHADQRVVEDFVYTRRYCGEGPYSIMHMKVSRPTSAEGKDSERLDTDKEAT